MRSEHRDATGQYLPTLEVGRYDCSTIAALRGYIARRASHVHPYEVVHANGVSLMVEADTCAILDKIIPELRAFGDGYQLARAHYGTGR